MTIGALSGTSSVAQSAQAGDNAQLGKEEFLKLLISQMQHQDPLEPMKNSEFVAQLATFSNVEQLVSVNDGITQLGQMQAAAYETQTANYIGKEVEVLTDQISVSTPGEEINTGFQLQGDAASVIVNFRNTRGEVVRSMDLGPQSAGDVEVQWNGYTNTGQTSIPGLYRIDVVAANSNGGPVNYETKVRGFVDGVSYDSGVPEIVIGSAKALASNVIGVYQSGSGN
jgi:flagellar basal-body rod modification protein FlgD